MFTVVSVSFDVGLVQVDPDRLNDACTVLRSEAGRLEEVHRSARTAMNLCGMVNVHLLGRLGERAELFQRVADELDARADLVRAFQVAGPNRSDGFVMRQLAFEGLASIDTAAELERRIGEWDGSDNDPILDRWTRELDAARLVEGASLIVGQFEALVEEIGAEAAAHNEVVDRLMQMDLLDGDSLPADWGDRSHDDRADYWMRTRLATFASVPDRWGEWAIEDRWAYFDAQGESVLQAPPCGSSLPSALGWASVQTCEHPLATQRLTAALAGVAVVSVAVATGGVAASFVGGATITFGGGGGGFALAGGGVVAGTTVVISETALAAGIAAVISGLGITYMIGEGGQAITSKSVRPGRDGPRNSYRMDVENPAPGGRDGQLHIHWQGAKYQYDFAQGVFKSPNGSKLPNALQKLLDGDVKFQKAMRNAFNYLNFTP